MADELDVALLVELSGTVCWLQLSVVFQLLSIGVESQNSDASKPELVTETNEVRLRTRVVLADERFRSLSNGRTTPSESHLIRPGCRMAAAPGKKLGGLCALRSVPGVFGQRFFS